MLVRLRWWHLFVLADSGRCHFLWHSLFVFSHELLQKLPRVYLFKTTLHKQSWLNWITFRTGCQWTGTGGVGCLTGFVCVCVRACVCVCVCRSAFVMFCQYFYSRTPVQSTTLTSDHPSYTTIFRVTDSVFCLYDPWPTTIPLTRPTTGSDGIFSLADDHIAYSRTNV